ncbi:MAG: hypothetical protein LIO57_02465 [Oscillospiraceae bacterium]|nr:hypothetical protein [Oscillospiraceae bacterium]MCD7792137.1 hypothetical protein [Oscillospiraceae bacterium]
MINFNSLKDKALGAMGQAADYTKDAANKAAEKAKSGTRIAKLKMDIAGERETIKKAYSEIGKLYYDTHKDAPEGFFIQLFEEVAMAQESISKMEAEIETLKDSGEEDDSIEVEFEEVVAEEETAACAEPEAAEPEAPAEPETPAEPEAPAEPDQPDAE